jgi:hypothetical protein
MPGVAVGAAVGEGSGVAVAEGSMVAVEEGAGVAVAEGSRVTVAGAAGLSCAGASVAGALHAAANKIKRKVAIRKVNAVCMYASPTTDYFEVPSFLASISQSGRIFNSALPFRRALILF